MTTRTSRILAAPVLALVLLLTSCAAPPAPRGAAARTPPVLALGAHNDTSTPFNVVSIPALARHRFDGRDLRLDRVVHRGLATTRYAVSYRSGRLRITGVMDVPRRAGRAPLVVLAHGWTAPADYASGDMLGREREALAEAGFVALQIDYRNHAGSTREEPGDVAAPLGYPEDLVNAIRAVRLARLPFVDASRVGLFGRSMGGGVVMDALAAVPDLADAAVLYSPVSSSAPDRFDRWVRPDPALRERVVAAFGTPSSRPGFWRRASARSYVDRIDVPLLVAHGTADRVCPVGWSRATVAALREAGQPAMLQEYAGEGHRFDRSWPLMMRRAVEFLRARV